MTSISNNAIWAHYDTLLAMLARSLFCWTPQLKKTWSLQNQMQQLKKSSRHSKQQMHGVLYRQNWSLLEASKQWLEHLADSYQVGRSKGLLLQEHFWKNLRFSCLMRLLLRWISSMKSSSNKQLKTTGEQLETSQSLSLLTGFQPSETLTTYASSKMANWLNKVAMMSFFESIRMEHMQV